MNTPPQKPRQSTMEGLFEILNDTINKAGKNSDSEMFLAFFIKLFLFLICPISLIGLIAVGAHALMAAK